MKFALIKGGVVLNIIVADQAFADSIASDWDAVICVDQMFPYPGPGWTYDGSQFTAPPPPPDDGP